MSHAGAASASRPAIPDAGLYAPLFSPWLGQGDFARVLQMAAPYTLVSADRCYVLYTLASQALALPGEFWECGVYRGGTAMLLAELLTHGRNGHPAKRLHLFDTFEGMPATDPQRDLHQRGDFADTDLRSVAARIGRPDIVTFHQGFIPQTFAGFEDVRIALAHVDVDIYRSILDCCEFIYPRLVAGGFMVFDDYGFPSCPGARQAVDEFFADKPERPLVLPTGQAIVVGMDSVGAPRVGDGRPEENGISLAQRGAALAGAGRLDEGIALLQLASRLDPRGDCLANLAVTLARAGRDTEAAEAFREALARAPEDPLLREDAEAFFRRLGARQGTPRDGNAAHENGRAAAVVAERVVKESPMALNNAGCAAGARGDLDGAARLLRNALQLAPHLADARRNLALVYRASKNWHAALAEYEALADGGGADAEVLEGMEACLRALGVEVDAAVAGAPRDGTLPSQDSVGPRAGDPGQDEQYAKRVRAEKTFYSREYQKPASRQQLTEEGCPTFTHVLERIRELERAATGGADFFQYIERAARRRERPRILSLASGPGGVELRLARQLQPGALIECIDLNEELLALGRQQAAAEGLNVCFLCQDINTLSLTPGAYDLIMAHAALHHFVALEHIFAEVARALKRDGEFVVCDVIARNGMRLWPETKVCIDTLWRLLPDRFRMNHALYDVPRVDAEYPDRDYQGDGFECVRSQDVLPLLQSAFRVKHFVPYFGMARRFFDRMYGPNYDLQQPLDKSILEFVWQLDGELIRTGTIRPEAAFLVLQRPDASGNGRG